MEGRLVQLDFSTAFARVRHHGLLYKLRSIGVGSTVFVYSNGVP